MKKLSLAFFGAPNFAANVLEKIIVELSDNVSVSAVFTQPDRPSGRKQTLTPTPVKLVAQKYKRPVFYNAEPSVLSTQLKGVDLVLLYAYGEMIPADILKIPTWGFWNIHPSLLPLYRGPSPITYPLLLGDKKTGVSLIEMDNRMDHGQIIYQEEYVIQPTDTQEVLKNNLSDIGYRLFKDNIQLLINGALHRKEQDHSKATYTRLLTKQDGFIPFTIVQKIIKNESLIQQEIPPIISDYYTKNKFSSPLDLNLACPELYRRELEFWNYYRALTPWPGLWTLVSINGVEKRLKITGMSLDTNHSSLITKVQLEGKKEVPLSTFLSAYPF